MFRYLKHPFLFLVQHRSFFKQKMLFPPKKTNPSSQYHAPGPACFVSLAGFRLLATLHQKHHSHLLQSQDLQLKRCELSHQWLAIGQMFSFQRSIETSIIPWCFFFQFHSVPQVTEPMGALKNGKKKHIEFKGETWVDLSDEETLEKRLWLDQIQGREKFPFREPRVGCGAICRPSKLVYLFFQESKHSSEKLRFQHLVIFEPKVATSPLDVITAEWYLTRKHWEPPAKQPHL